VTVVGETESSEFHRQTTVIAEAWAPHGIPIDHLVVPGADHFTVIAPYSDEASALVEACL
jgi:arylformamidase